MLGLLTEKDVRACAGQQDVEHPVKLLQGTLRGQADKRTRGLFCAEYSAAQERQQIVLSIDSDILTDQSMALSILLCDTGFVVFARFRIAVAAADCCGLV